MPASWPTLDFAADRATYQTLHLWTQIVGKIRLAQMPWVNHAWHVPLYVTARGLTTGLMPYGARGFELSFDFHVHVLRVDTSDGFQRALTLEGLSVASFYVRLMAILRELNLPVEIMDRPVELPDPITPFPDDTEHDAYDPGAARRLWGALVHVQRVFTRFRAGFTGKVSPVHFFWGAFDLAVTRFSGRPAPKHPGGVPNCADWVMEDAYAQEVSSAGFWPGEGLGEAAFYSYIYPEPDGFREARIQPEAAYFHEDLGEYVLPYESVRTATDPDAALMAFLESTYAAAADLASWDREALEGSAPMVAE